MLPEDFNPKQIDPALLTFQEWAKIVDPSCKSHPSSAYDVSVKQWQQDYNADSYTKAQYPKLIQRLRVNGLYFEIRLKVEKKGRRIKTDPDGMPVRIGDDFEYYTDDEIKKLGWHQYEWNLGAFQDDTFVASVQDEWGCMLVMVGSEYRSFGLGRILLKIAYGLQPDKPSGGFTSAGYQTFARIHADFVRDALRSGKYTSLVKQGKMTMERVKEIVASAKPPGKKRPEINLNSNDSNDWMLYVGEAGDFIIYDRKLRDLVDQGMIDDEQFSHFADDMIKGMVYVFETTSGWCYLRRFGGATRPLKGFLMSCAVEYALRGKVDLYLEDGEPADLNPAMGTVEPASKKIGFSAQRVVPTGKRMPYDQMGALEKKWRKSFDRYGEFHNRILEMAFGKYNANS